MDDDPFPEMKISDTTALDLADKREICSFCGRKRMYFCYSCIRYVNNLEEAMPKVKVTTRGTHGLCCRYLFVIGWLFSELI